MVFGIVVRNEWQSGFVKSVYSFKIDRVNVRDDF
jgi:hypothetical protein